MPSGIAPPLGGVAKSAHEGMFALVPSSDFGEITDTVSAYGGLCGRAFTYHNFRRSLITPPVLIAPCAYDSLRWTKVRSRSYSP
jgi:hypothetical protein